MASGAVILGRPETDVLEFYASRCKRLIPALVFWTFVYIGFVALTSKGFWAVGPLRWLAGAALAGEVYVHLWYIPMFIWLMLFSPYLNMTIVGKKPTRKEILILIILFVVLFSFKLISEILLYGFEKEFVWFQEFAYFIPYYILGYYLKIWFRLPKRKMYIPLAAFVACGCMITVLNYSLWKYTGVLMDYVAGSNSGIIVFVMTIALFMAAMSREQTNTGKITKILSDTSFGIYLIHPMLLIGGSSLLEPFIGNGLIYMVVNVFGTLLVSTALVFVMRKNQWLVKVL